MRGSLSDQFGAARRGIYFLANDAVREQAIAFLSSLQDSNSGISLCLIPFDSNTVELRKLQQTFKFSVWENLTLLNRCDLLSRKVCGVVQGQFRKLAIWSGPYAHFIYIDVDTVVLKDLTFVFSCMQNWDVLTSHSDMPETERWVWRDRKKASAVLTPRQISYSANTGFIASRAGVLTIDMAVDRLSSAMHILSSMAESYEQPYLNYLIVTSGKSYSSLSNVYKLTHAPYLSLERWGGRHLGETKEGRFLKDLAPPVLLVHWAGEWLRVERDGGEIKNCALWTYYRNKYVV